MKFGSFISILLGVNLIGVAIGTVVGYYSYYLNKELSEYYLYLSVPILTIGSLLMVYGTLYKK